MKKDLTKSWTGENVSPKFLVTWSRRSGDRRSWMTKTDSLLSSKSIWDGLMVARLWVTNVAAQSVLMKMYLYGLEPKP